MAGNLNKSGHTIITLKLVVECIVLPITDKQMFLKKATKINRPQDKHFSRWKFHPAIPKKKRCRYKHSKRHTRSEITQAEVRVRPASTKELATPTCCPNKSKLRSTRQAFRNEHNTKEREEVGYSSRYVMRTA